MNIIRRIFGSRDNRDEIPSFTYHPDPVATGAIKRKDAACPCCSKATHYVYAKSPYCVDEVDDLCPWCIADGSAAQKFDATFIDESPLVEAGVPPKIIEEVARRTPGYISWQQDAWLSCCEDACVFHGNLRKSEMQSLPFDTIAEFRREHRVDDHIWGQLFEDYEPGGSPAIYKFVCRHCARIHLGFDFH